MPTSVSRQQASQQTSKTAATSAPQKPKQSTAAAKTTAPAAGWGAKATGGALKITAARIDEGVKTTSKVGLPAGYTGTTSTIENNLKDTVHGTKVGFEQSAQQLNVSGPNGQKFTIGTDKKAIDEMLGEWRSEVKSAKGEPANEFSNLSWDSQSSVSGVGTAGKLLSVSLGGSSYTGGAHPNSGTQLATYDARTGKQVKLDELLTPQQMNALVKDIGAKLARLKGPDDVDGQSFNWGGPEELKATIAENFALTQDKSGKVKIEIAWESGVHALGPLSAHFTVDAPSDKAFKAKIGLE